MAMNFLYTLAAENPVDHVGNVAPAWGIGELFGMKNVWIWNAHVGSLVLSGLITVALLWWAAKRIATGPEQLGSGRFVTSNPLAHAIEVVCVYLRESTVRPLLGERTDRFMPFLWTIFFFIL